MYLSEHIQLRLGSVVLDEVTGASDRLSWSLNPDGQFTVKSAYALLTENEMPRQHMGAFFDRIWKVKATERVRCFFWLLGQQSIMTNMERFRRHLCTTNICQVCTSGVETILHTLRDCPAMVGVWNRLVPRRRRNSFFNGSLLEWMYDNLSDTRETDTYSWSTLFAVSVWWAWKWRCGDIFGGLGRCRDRVQFLRNTATEIFKANLAVGSGIRKPVREERQIAWIPPTEGWVKLNTDGGSRGNPGLATAGGVLRDSEGNWITGFALNIGICTAPLAELWGVYYGLYIAWEKGLTRVELEVDSEIVVGFLTAGISDSHPLSFLASLCYGFLSRDWIVRIRHVYREANRLADGLANYAFTLSRGFHSLVVSPECVSLIVFEYALGIARARAVPVM